MKKTIIKTLPFFFLFAGIHTTEATTHINFVDTLDNGTILQDAPFQKDSRIYGYFYNNYSQIEYKIPEGMCMTSEGLPTILPSINSKTTKNFIPTTDVWNNQGTFIVTADAIITDTKLGNHFNLSTHSLENKHNEDTSRYTKQLDSIHNGENFFSFHFDRNLESPFEYSTDNGQTWKYYLNRTDADIPNDCSITNFRVDSAISMSQGSAIFTYNMKVKSDDTTQVTSSLWQDITEWDDTNWTAIHKRIEHTNILFKNGIGDTIAEKCEELPINITLKERTATPPNDTTKPADPVDPNKPTDPAKPVDPVKPVDTPKETTGSSSSSGPGGYVPNVTPVSISTPNITPELTPTSITETKTEEKEKEAEKKEEKKPAFTMEFTNTVEQVLPKLLPKMGTTLKNIGGRINTLVETRIDTKSFRLAGSTNTELSHWLQVLDKNEQNLDKYIVIPSNGLVMPIIDVKSSDKAYKNFLSGKTEHFYDYAEKWAVGIPDIGNKFGENGNKIIGGHSSWWKNSSAKYKTHFQKIINLRAGTEIWVYEKNTETGEYTRHIYKTIESYNTSETDVSILKNTPDKSLLTLFTCTPIGGDIGRWVVKGELVK